MKLAEWHWHCMMCNYTCKYEWEIIEHLDQLHGYKRFNDYDFTSDAIVGKERLEREST